METGIQPGSTLAEPSESPSQGENSLVSQWTHKRSGLRCTQKLAHAMRPAWLRSTEWKFSASSPLGEN